MFTHINHNITRPFAKEEHMADGHYYRTNEGKLYPSITTILKLLDPKDWYPMWVSSISKKMNISIDEAEKECKKIGDNSMAVGTQLHKYAEQYLNNKNPDIVSPEGFEIDPYSLFTMSLKKWLDDNISEVHGTEFKLYSDELGLAGTVDLVARLKTGEMAIIDFKNSRNQKTPGKIKEAHYYEQMCAYSKMWEFCTGEKIETGIVVVVSWDGKTRPFKCKLSDYESDLWNWIIKYKEWKALNS
jgi:hypothetical protein